MSLRVDDRSQRSSCFQAGTSVARDNRRATSVQPHFFDSGSAAAAGGQERAGQTLFVRLDTGEEGGKIRQQRLRVRSARGGQEKALHRKLCGEVHWGATYARRRKCENALELQGKRAPAKSPGQLIARESTLDQETALWARWGAHRERVEADA